MSSQTTIEWTEATWNPVTGCTRVSDGCTHCYIERTVPMRMSHRRFDGPGIGATLPVQTHPERLSQPLHWAKPRRVFVNSMSDLFHEAVPDEYIAHVFAVMAAAAQHTFQVLTKRPARMRALLSSAQFQQDVRDLADAAGRGGWDESWPLPNVWLGISAESQKWADLRIPQLLNTAAAVRFVSAEPLLGPITLPVFCTCGCNKPISTADDEARLNPGYLNAFQAETAPRGTLGIDWVIIGGESGPGSRPMHPDWARSLRDQCQTAGVAVYFKQHGDWVGHADGGRPDGVGRSPWADRQPDAWVRECDGAVVDEETALADGGSFTAVWRVGKKAAGRSLDGQVWDQFPRVGGRR